MPKRTLLYLVQDILDSMNSDNVNSISDTLEAQQVASIVQDSYYNLIDSRDWPFLEQSRQLESVGDITKPTKLKIPETINKIVDLRYRVDLAADTKQTWKILIYLTPSEFLDIVMSRDTSSADVTSYTNDSSVGLLINTVTMPTYWTSFDDEYVYLDSFKLTEESSVQQSKTIVNTIVTPTWTVSDTFTPDLPANMFSMLLNEAKSTAYLEIDQRPNPKAESHSQRQYTKFKELGSRADRQRNGVNWGR